MQRARGGYACVMLVAGHGIVAFRDPCEYSHYCSTASALAVEQQHTARTQAQLLPRHWLQLLTVTVAATNAAAAAAATAATAANHMHRWHTAAVLWQEASLSTRH
eukprot:21540-Heterococcus_DN1.PRE.1